MVERPILGTFCAAPACGSLYWPPLSDAFRGGAVGTVESTWTFGFCAGVFFADVFGMRGSLAFWPAQRVPVYFVPCFQLCMGQRREKSAVDAGSHGGRRFCLYHGSAGFGKWSNAGSALLAWRRADANDYRKRLDAWRVAVSGNTHVIYMATVFCGGRFLLRFDKRNPHARRYIQQ